LQALALVMSPKLVLGQFIFIIFKKNEQESNKNLEIMMGQQKPNSLNK
jgi:hypothetical protein